MRHLIYEI